MRHSMLFLPASSPRMIQSSFLFNARSIIFDLEDAVSLTEKDSARILLKEALDFFDFKDSEVVVRINPMDTEYALDDIAMLKTARFDAILLPKATSYSVDLLLNALGDFKIKVIALVETCQGVHDAYDIAKNPKIDGIFLGGEDLAVDLEVERTKKGDEIFHARTSIINACKIFKKDCIDTPFTDTDDVDGLINDTKFAKSLGFTGKACINPRQVFYVNETFTPTNKEIEYALLVISEAEKAKQLGLGAFSINGKMIDNPIINRAKRVIDVAKKVGVYHE